jgi:hypothetical protein
VVVPNSVFGGGVGNKEDHLWTLLVDDFYVALLKYRIVIVKKEIVKL